MLAVLFFNRMSLRKKALNKRLLQNESKSSNDKYCRTCLNTEGLVAIFFNKELEQKRSNDLRLVTGLEIKMNDGLPQKMCIQCLETINTTLQFRRTSKKAHKALLDMTLIPKNKRLTSKNITPISKQKIEVKEDIHDYNYDYDIGDNFQNDHDYGVSYEDDLPLAKQFSKKTSLKKGKRSAIPNASSYKCGTCNKEFRMKATYKAHMRFHTNYCVCEACGKRCRNNNQLQEHKRARHGLGRIHKCAYCEYSSATKEALTIHERRHTGERPYICDHCGATFHRRSNLVQHIAIHLPDKNFQCDMCPKKLKSKKFLQIHKHNAHTGKKYGYLCPICGHRFEKPNKVRAHTTRVHGVPADQNSPIVRVQL